LIIKTRKKIKIIEVGPRDGFQNIKKYIPLQTKIEIISLLIKSGIRNIEITSFVSPKAVPQMKDSEQVARIVKSKNTQNINIIALVPNLYGAKLAKDLKVDCINFVVSTSEKHNMANMNRTIAESLDELKEIIKYYRQDKNSPQIKMGIATAFGCPFEGFQPVSKVLGIVNKAVEAGVRSFNFADTIGCANPAQVKRFWEGFLANSPKDINYGIHFHDTQGLGLANVIASLEYPIKWVESSFGGFGGCPFAPGAAGNIATEDLVNMLESMEIKTDNINKEILIKAVEILFPYDTNALNSHMYKALSSSEGKLK